VNITAAKEQQLWATLNTHTITRWPDEGNSLMSQHTCHIMIHVIYICVLIYYSAHYMTRGELGRTAIIHQHSKNSVFLYNFQYSWHIQGTFFFVAFLHTKSYFAVYTFTLLCVHPIFYILYCVDLHPERVHYTHTLYSTHQCSGQCLLTKPQALFDTPSSGCVFMGCVGVCI